MAVGEVLFICLEFIGTVSFAVSGAMAALEKRVDLFGVIFLGITTALAGGHSEGCDYWPGAARALLRTAGI